MSFMFQVGSDASRERLDKLIAERLKPGVNKEDIDKRIWDLFGETWSVMFTDLSGFFPPGCRIRDYPLSPDYI